MWNAFMLAGGGATAAGLSAIGGGAICILGMAGFIKEYNIFKKLGIPVRDPLPELTPEEKAVMPIWSPVRRSIDGLILEGTDL